MDFPDLGPLLAAAIAEDFGPRRLDLTSACLIPAEAEGVAQFRTRQAGVVAGLPALAGINAALHAGLRIQLHVDDGTAVAAGTVLATVEGPLRGILGLERTALNLLTHLSGVATLTRRFVDAAAGTRARICATRKTHWGFRGLEKYAVVRGGGDPHRMGLFDAMLVKDNHIAHLPPDALAAHLAAAAARARALNPGLQFVMVEVDRLDQFAAVLGADGVDIVMLDNMAPADIRRAVALRDAQAPALQLEISGGVTLERIPMLAATGVDRISVGALTHSAPALDIGLDIGPAA